MLGLFIGIGGVAFTVWSGARLPAQAKPLFVGIAGAGLAAVLLSIGFQGADALALPLDQFWRLETYTAGFRTAYGASALLAACALMAALVALIIPSTNAKKLLAVGAVTTGAVALAASGHASNAMPQWLTRPSVFVHALTVALWAGSLVPLWLLFRGRTRNMAVIQRFSHVIVFVLAGLVVSGAVLAVIQLEHVAAIWTTDYGRVFAGKLALLAILFGLAVYNRHVLTPGLLRGARSGAAALRFIGRRRARLHGSDLRCRRPVAFYAPATCHRVKRASLRSSARRAFDGRRHHIARSGRPD